MARAPKEHRRMADPAETGAPRFKCQIRLSIAKRGVRVQVTAAPDSSGFTGVRVWPDGNGGKERVVELAGGRAASADLDLSRNEDLWLEVSSGGVGPAKDTVRLKYQHKKPFGFRVSKLINPGKADLIGSVPPIKRVRG